MSTPFHRDGPDSLWLHMLQATLSMGVQHNPTVVQQKIAAMLTGIKKYQTWPTPPIHRAHRIVWQEGASRLMFVKPSADVADQPPIILVPSLINGWEILDLLPDLSFARYLAAQVGPVYILDWGDLTIDCGIQTLVDLLHGRLAAAVRAVRARHNQPVTAMGYCMGGVLVAGAMPVIGDDIDRVVYLATPWDFHAGDPLVTRLVRGWQAVLGLPLGATPHIPNSQIQALFAQVDPEMAAQKFTRFAGMTRDDPAAQIFMAVEDWLRTGHDLPGVLARQCLQDWYHDNRTAGGAWRVGDYYITPGLLAGPHSLVIAPRRDRLVEPQTARALASFIGSRASLMSPDMGHIGLMSSPRAKDQVWAPMTEWLHRRNHAPQHGRRLAAKA